MPYVKKLDMDLRQALTFPEMNLQETQEFRRRHYISRPDLEKYTGINRETIKRIDRGYSVSTSVLTLYYLSMERLMMLEKGYIPAYRKIGESTFK